MNSWGGIKSWLRAYVRQGFAYPDWKIEETVKEHWQVYKRKICSRDFILLQKVKIGKTGRTSYFRDKCQQLYLPEEV